MKVIPVEVTVFLKSYFICRVINASACGSQSIVSLCLGSRDGDCQKLNHESAPQLI